MSLIRLAILVIGCVSDECQEGAEILDRSLVQRNRSSSRVMLAEAKVSAESFGQAFGQAAGQAFGQAMAAALQGGTPQLGLEVLLPILAILALLSCYVLTRDVLKTQRPEATRAPASGPSGPSGPPVVRTSAKRASRPAEHRPLEDVLCLCPSLMVPEKVECSILVPRVATLQLSQRRLMPLCDLNGGVIFALEVFPEKHLDGNRLILHNPSRERTFAYCKHSGSGFSLHGDASQAQLTAGENCCLLTSHRHTVRFLTRSSGSINASNDEGQLLAYSDPGSPDSEGVPRLLLKVGPKVDAGLMLLCYAAVELLSGKS